MEYNKVIYNGETLIDLSEDTVSEETLKKGVIAHNSAGEQIVGTMATDEPYQWERPADMPDLNSIDLSGYDDCVLLTMDMSGGTPFLSFKANTSSGSGAVVLWEQGYMENGEFVPVTQYKGNKNTTLKQWLENCHGDDKYNVVKITTPGLKMTACGFDTAPQIESQTAVVALCNPVVEIRAKLTNVNNLTNNKLSSYYAQHIQIENCTLMTSLASVFTNCMALRQIDFVDCNTSKCTSFQGVFNACYSLERITGIEDWDTSKSTTFTSCFYNCSLLRENGFDTSKWDTSNATNLSSMYGYMNALKRFKIYHSTEKATNVSNMFSNCIGLEYLDATGFVTSAVTNISTFVQTDKNLKTFISDGWDTSGVTTATGIFQNTNCLQVIDVSHWDFSNVTSMGSIFTSVNGCYDLRIPENVHLGFTYNSTSATKNCLLDMAERLGTASGSQTITLGNNKYKLTAAEKAIITEKGWTIA